MTDWSQVVQQHGAIVWKTVYRLLHNEADAADCFQDTFISAVKLSESLEVRNWPGLLKRLATARASDRLRQQYRELSRHKRLKEEFENRANMEEPSQVAAVAELAEHSRDAMRDSTNGKPKFSALLAWRVAIIGLSLPNST